MAGKRGLAKKTATGATRPAEAEDKGRKRDDAQRLDREGNEGPRRPPRHTKEKGWPARNSEEGVSVA